METPGPAVLNYRICEGGDHVIKVSGRRLDQVKCSPCTHNSTCRRCLRVKETRDIERVAFLQPWWKKMHTFNLEYNMQAFQCGWTEYQTLSGQSNETTGTVVTTQTNLNMNPTKLTWTHSLLLIRNVPKPTSGEMFLQLIPKCQCECVFKRMKCVFGSDQFENSCHSVCIWMNTCVLEMEVAYTPLMKTRLGPITSGAGRESPTVCGLQVVWHRPKHVANVHRTPSCRGEALIFTAEHRKQI